MKNLFELAEMQLRKERKEVNLLNVLEYIGKIRHWLDIQARNKKVSESRENNKKLAVVV